MSYKEFETIGTCDGIPVIYCPNTITSNGLSIACATLFLGLNGETFHGIGVDDSFLKLSGNVKDFFVYHELGHILNGDITTDPTLTAKLLNQRLSGVIPEMEIKADEYAFDRITSMYGIDGATYIVSMIKNKIDAGMKRHPGFVTDVGCNEMIDRMNRLLNVSNINQLS